MLERRARILAGADVNRIRRAKKNAERIQVMHAHVQQCEPPIPIQPRLPVRHCAHFDRAKHRRAQIAAIEQRLQRADGLIPPHILIDCERDAALFTDLHNSASLIVVVAKRLLGQNAFQFRPGRAAAFAMVGSCWSGGSAMSRISMSESAISSSIVS